MPQPDVDIDLGRLLTAVWEKKALVAGLTAAAAGLAFVVTGMINPLYKSETRLLIETREPVYSSEQTSQAANSALDERAVSSQVEILRSTDLIKQVARDLGPGHRVKNFDAAANPSAIGDVLVMLGLKKDPLEVPAEERVLKAFYSKLEVYAVPGSRVIGIEFSSQDASLAAEVPNALVNAYMASQSGAKTGKQTSTRAPGSSLRSPTCAKESGNRKPRWRNTAPGRASCWSTSRTRSPPSNCPTFRPS